VTTSPIYLDHHATTPLDPRVLRAMLPWLEQRFGNADSRSHRYGRAARDAIEVARAEVAALLNARPDEVVFTSGTTESNALALLGGLSDGRAGQAVTQATEHRAVLEPFERLEKRGIRVTVVGVDPVGRVDMEAMANAVAQRPRLVSLMLANNEIGTHQPICAIAKLADEAGVAMHVDAAQGIGYLPLDVRATPVDLVSLSAHKIYGPQGVGALFVRRFGKLKPEPMLLGGGQEHGLRSGTSNVAGIVGFGAAAAIMTSEGKAEAERLGRQQARLVDSLGVVGMHRHGDPVDSHPGNLNVRFDGVSAARLLVEVEEHVALSTGSACSSGGRPSHVLLALGLDEEARRSAIRIGLGRNTSDGEIDLVGAILRSAVERIRGALDGAPQRT